MSVIGGAALSDGVQFFGDQYKSIARRAGKTDRITVTVVSNTPVSMFNLRSPNILSPFMFVIKNYPTYHARLSWH